MSEANFQEELVRARQHTDSLFGSIDPGSYYDRPIADRNRIIFYIGHVEAFDWNQLGKTVLDLPAFDGQLDQLFAAGIDPEPGKAPHDQPSDWPTLKNVRSYIQRTRDLLDQHWSSLPEDRRQMAIEHRWMHAETLAYIMHSMPFEKKRNGHDRQHPSAPAPANPMIPVPAGVATLGKARGAGFGWDNEFQELQVDVPAFAMSQYKITNGEYLEFVRAGGPVPHFWTQQGPDYSYRGMFELVPLPMNWPVWVTLEQAAQYAAWRGKSLPSEAQFHRAAYGSEREERPQPWSDAGHVTSNNYDFRRWDPAPVDASPEGNSAFGFSQMVGNGWEWTNTVFGPLPGFEPADYYPGYSSNFFDDRHYVMKGASPRTASLLVRRSLRNWFRPGYPYVYAGFRLVDR